MGAPLSIETLELDEPHEKEALVRIAAAGVCHSDLHIMKGDWPIPLPAVLGHEGSPVVEQVGPGVTTVKPGDHCILVFAPNCGHCAYRARRRASAALRSSRASCLAAARRNQQGDAAMAIEFDGWAVVR